MRIRALKWSQEFSKIYVLHFYNIVTYFPMNLSKGSKNIRY